jgi:uncharacterized membrane protein (DUF485 family)
MAEDQSATGGEKVAENPKPSSADAAAATAAKQRQEGVSYVLVRIVDHRTPFPDIAFLKLAALPRPGDLIKVQTGGGSPLYKVEWINFDPYLEFQVSAGCSPLASGPAAVAADDAGMKQRMDDYIKTRLQLFDKAEAYSKAMILAGYAGVFGLWSFVKDVLTARATEWSALLVGISLVIYVTWEIIAMVYVVTMHDEFNRLALKTTTDFFNALDAFNNKLSSAAIQYTQVWRVVLGATVLFGYAGALLLLYDAAAKLAGMSQLP